MNAGVDMRYVEVGGERLSVVGLGTWQFGAAEWGYGDEYAQRTAHEIVHRALDAGVNLIDTAEIYGFGRSERIVGEAIRERRDEVFVASKILPVMPLAPIVEQRARGSARRLGIDTIDLYQIHWSNPIFGLSTTMAGMRRLQDDGIIRHVGVSNFRLGRWKGAERALGGPILTDQVRYNLIDRAPETDRIPFAQAEGRAVIAYSPLAQGFLSAKYGPDRAPRGTARLGNSLFTPENLRRASELFETIRDVARAHDATPSQVALAWVIRRPNVVAIPGAATVEQLEQNVAAVSLHLTEEDDARLTGAANRFRPLTGPGALPSMAANVPRQLAQRRRG